MIRTGTHSNARVTVFDRASPCGTRSFDIDYARHSGRSTGGFNVLRFNQSS